MSLEHFLQCRDLSLRERLAGKVDDSAVRFVNPLDDGFRSFFVKPASMPRQLFRPEIIDARMQMIAMRIKSSISVKARRVCFSSFRSPSWC
jgi:hypothetical protein